MKFFYCILIFYLIIPFCISEYEIYEKKYLQKFDEKCSKYAFIQAYSNIMKSSTNRYFIYVFSENGYSNGGLGDRLGGLVTAVAYALRYRRILLIQGDESFNKLFKPYFFANESDETHNWGKWDRSGWKDSDYSDTTVYHCVNPKPGNVKCALDHDLPDVRVLRFFGNRSYLCRWLVKQSLGISKDIQKALEIDLQTNLYDVAGCMLRLALHPTKFLWKSLMTIRKASLLQSSNILSQIHGHHGSPPLDDQEHGRSRSSAIDYQVGVHFRCGDSSFRQKDQQPNPNCVYLSNSSWKGTSFGDDYSLDSPIDLATCGQKKLLEYAQQRLTIRKDNTSAKSAVFLASDNHDSSKQMLQSLHSNTVVIHPTSTCHIDKQKSLDCSTSTIVQWFMFALSDVLITQSSLPSFPDSVYYDSDEINYIKSPYPRQLPPISAFSRFAVIYGLNGDNLYYGNCQAVNSTTIGHFTHGNWICTPKMFF
eukprot:gene10803-11775_t